MRTTPDRRGFSLIEVLLVMIIMALVLATVWAVFSSVVGGDTELRGRVELQMDAVRALKEMSSLLKQSGPQGPASGGGTTIDDWNTRTVCNANKDNEYPLIMTDLQGTSPSGQLAFTNSGYDWVKSYVSGGTTYTNAVIPQNAASPGRPTPLLAEGLGPSQEILFRIAKDADHLNADGTVNDKLRTTPASKPPAVGTTAPTMSIEWGNEYHALVVVPGRAGYTDTAGNWIAPNELQHLTFFTDVSGNMKFRSKTVLCQNVQRLVIEAFGLPTPSPIPWPLGFARPMSPGEDPAAYAAAITQAYPAPPTNAYELRLTLCLVKPDPKDPKKQITAWTQTNVLMRSVIRTAS